MPWRNSGHVVDQRCHHRAGQQVDRPVGKTVAQEPNDRVAANEVADPGIGDDQDRASRCRAGVAGCGVHRAFEPALVALRCLCFPSSVQRRGCRRPQNREASNLAGLRMSRSGGITPRVGTGGPDASIEAGRRLRRAHAVGMPHPTLRRLRGRVRGGGGAFRVGTAHQARSIGRIFGGRLCPPYARSTKTCR